MVDASNPRHRAEVAGIQQSARVGRQERPLHAGLHVWTERERRWVDGPQLREHGAGLVEPQLREHGAELDGPQLREHGAGLDLDGPQMREHGAGVDEPQLREHGVG